jgi:hypothetical protein
MFWPPAIAESCTKALAVVLNRQDEHAGLQRNLNPRLGGGGMFDNVIERFLDNQKKIVPHVSESE